MKLKWVIKKKKLNSRSKSVIVSKISTCSAIWCFQQPENELPIDINTEKKFYVGYALDGTECEENSICYAGECIPKPDDYNLY